MAYSASKIALEFVNRGISEGLPVTQMKLQKMVYFAHGIHLALYDNPLIKEHFQAWKYGPVIPSIYKVYKFYGSQPIVDTELISLMSSDIDSVELDENSEYSITNTWDTLKKINASQLSNWTHKQGSPWDKYYIEGSSDVVIPNHEIRDYFKMFLVAKEAKSV